MRTARLRTGVIPVQHERPGEVVASRIRWNVCRLRYEAVVVTASVRVIEDGYAVG